MRRVISKSFFILISIVVITLFYINPVLFKNTILNQINSKTGQGGGFEKYLVIYNQLKINLLNKLSFFSMLFLILISYFEKKKSLNLTLAKNLFFLIIIPIIYIYSFVGGNFSPSHYFVNFLTIYITLFSLNYLTFTKNNYFLVIYLSFVIAFLTICWSSGNGYIASTIVLLPLLFFILLNYSLYIKSNLEKFGFLILVGMIIICLTKYQFFIYGDDSINELNIMVNKGPYKGIFTSKTKSNYLDALESSFDFCKKKFNPKTLFVYDELPAGYLISNLSPLTKSSWVLSAADGNLNRLRFVNYFREKKEYPDSILKILIMPIQIVNQKHLNYKAEDSIEKFINLNYTICKKNEHFQILIYNQIY